MNEVAPVIDLKSSSALPKKTLEAFRKLGFFYVVGHSVSLDLQEELIQLSRDFFSLPIKEKMKFRMENYGRSWRGYFPVGTELTGGVPDKKEGLYFGKEHPKNHSCVLAGTPTFGSNPWPSREMQLCMTEYMRKMKELSQKILSLVSEGIGLDSHYFENVYGKEPTEFLRIFGYPHSEKSSDDWGVQEHTDMGFLTVLLQDKSGGLEAKNLSGEWVTIPPIENAFVINIGDMLEYWTQGVLRATPHRVQNTSAKHRVSIPYFFDPSWEARLNPIAEHNLSHLPKKNFNERWDKLDLHSFDHENTYGEFVWQKIRGVFPHLDVDK